MKVYAIIEIDPGAGPKGDDNLEELLERNLRRAVEATAEEVDGTLPWTRVTVRDSFSVGNWVAELVEKGLAS